jgi:hypothetical protein
MIRADCHFRSRWSSDQGDGLNVDGRQMAWVFLNRRKLYSGSPPQPPRPLYVGAGPYLGSEGVPPSEKKSRARRPRSKRLHCSPLVRPPCVSPVGAHCVRPWAFGEVQGACNAPLRMGLGLNDPSCAPITRAPSPAPCQKNQGRHIGLPLRTRAAPSGYGAVRRKAA